MTDRNVIGAGPQATRRALGAHSEHVVSSRMQTVLQVSVPEP